ncbi:MAG: hypothetical protein Kow0068_06130 [Marinilabiliales bacterium]
MIFLYSQSSLDSYNKSFKDRLFYGGGFGLSIGSVTQIDIAPQVGFRVTDRFNTGVGVIYKYISVSDRYSMSFSTSIYGFKVFTNYMVTSQLFPHAELESLSLERKYFDFINNFPQDGRFWYHSIFLGIGYYMPISPRSGSYILALYNINDSSNSPYSSPWIFRVGFNF